MQSLVKLYIRVRLPDGSHPFLKAAFASNGRVRPGYAIHEGKAASFPGSSYYLRYKSNGKRVWEPTGDDASLAMVNLQRKAHALEGATLGLAEPPATVIPAPIISAPVVSHPDALTELLLDIDKDVHGSKASGIPYAISLAFRNTTGVERAMFCLETSREL